MYKNALRLDYFFVLNMAIIVFFLRKLTTGTEHEKNERHSAVCKRLLNGFFPDYSTAYDFFLVLSEFLTKPS